MQYKIERRVPVYPDCELDAIREVLQIAQESEGVAYFKILEPPDESSRGGRLARLWHRIFPPRYQRELEVYRS